MINAFYHKVVPDPRFLFSSLYLVYMGVVVYSYDSGINKESVRIISESHPVKKNVFLSNIIWNTKKTKSTIRNSFSWFKCITVFLNNACVKETSIISTIAAISTALADKSVVTLQ